MKVKAFRTKSALYLPKYSGTMLLLEFLRDNSDTKLFRVWADREKDNGELFVCVSLFPKSDERDCLKYINDNI